jgi:hypothetical protein
MPLGFWDSGGYNESISYFSHLWWQEIKSMRLLGHNIAGCIVVSRPCARWRATESFCDVAGVYEMS